MASVRHHGQLRGRRQGQTPSPEKSTGQSKFQAKALGFLAEVGSVLTQTPVNMYVATDNQRAFVH